MRRDLVLPALLLAEACLAAGIIWRSSTVVLAVALGASLGCTGCAYWILWRGERE